MIAPLRGKAATLKAADAFARAAEIVEARRGWSGPIGMSMEGTDDPPNDPGDDGSLADSEVIKIDGREWTVGQLKKIAATEKRQGKAAGQREVLETLGVENVDAAKALIEAAREAQRKDETEAERKQREADEARRVADQEKRTAAEERRTAALERALVRRGVGDDDLDDAVTILAKQVPADADPEAIAEAADKLKERRAELFGGTTAAPPRTPAGGLPPGAPRSRPTPQGQPFGAGGLARAEKRFGKAANSA